MARYEHLPIFREAYDLTVHILDGERVAYSFAPPRPALRIAQQKAQLCHRLPGHVLVVQMGKWWELWGGYPENLLPKGWQQRL